MEDAGFDVDGLDVSGVNIVATNELDAKVLLDVPKRDAADLAKLAPLGRQLLVRTVRLDVFNQVILRDPANQFDLVWDQDRYLFLLHNVVLGHDRGNGDEGKNDLLLLDDASPNVLEVDHLDLAHEVVALSIDLEQVVFRLAVLRQVELVLGENVCNKGACGLVGVNHKRLAHVLKANVQTHLELVLGNFFEDTCKKKKKKKNQSPKLAECKPLRARASFHLRFNNVLDIVGIPLLGCFHSNSDN